MPTRANPCLASLRDLAHLDHSTILGVARGGRQSTGGTKPVSSLLTRESVRRGTSAFTRKRKPAGCCGRRVLRAVCSSPRRRPTGSPAQKPYAGAVRTGFVQRSERTLEEAQRGQRDGVGLVTWASNRERRRRSVRRPSRLATRTSTRDPSPGQKLPDRGVALRDRQPARALSGRRCG